MIKDNTIIYIGIGTNMLDTQPVVTVGTTTMRGWSCREWNKQMRIFWVHTCDDTKSRGAWEYWEKNLLSPWISTILEPCRVHYDRKSMPLNDEGKPMCNGRTNIWWALTVTEQEIIDHVKEKIARG